MDAIAMLRQQLHTVNLRLHHSAGDLTRREMAAAPLAGVNPIGFILWHMARSQDWAVNTAVRGEPEVIRSPRWSNTTLAHLGMGTGFDADEAALVARTVALPELLAYADDVHSAATEWLSGIDEAYLDTIPHVAAHDAPYPEYQTAGFRAEMDSGPEHDDATEKKGGLPAWIFLTSVAVTHLHRHLGEVDLLKGLLRRTRPA